LFAYVFNKNRVNANYLFLISNNIAMCVCVCRNPPSLPRRSISVDFVTTIVILSRSLLLMLKMQGIREGWRYDVIVG